MFWEYAFERAVKTIAQAGLAAIGANSLGIVGIDWRGIGSVAALAGLVSVLTSLTSFSGGGSPLSLPQYVAPEPMAGPVGGSGASDSVIAGQATPAADLPLLPVPAVV